MRSSSWLEAFSGTDPDSPICTHDGDVFIPSLRHNCWFGIGKLHELPSSVHHEFAREGARTSTGSVFAESARRVPKEMGKRPSSVIFNCWAANGATSPAPPEMTGAVCAPPAASTRITNVCESGVTSVVGSSRKLSMPAQSGPPGQISWHCRKTYAPRQYPERTARAACVFPTSIVGDTLAGPFIR
jgi:hypothetical protein